MISTTTPLDDAPNAIIITDALSTSPFKPPPHLEARFRRRRRPGTHSPSTHLLALHSSTHLATTRRQILLEARKSHLRARFAHIDRVRHSRAASHADVSERLLALEASMLAAQKSRDAILAKIAAGCASEVQKAKVRAEEMKRKREEEKRRVMVESQGRLEEAEKRRLEVLRERGKRRSRSGSAEREEVGVKRREDAARRIQGWWRERRDERIVEAFKGLGITVETVKKKDFGVVSKMLMDPEVLKGTGRLLRRLQFVQDSDAAVAEKACRCFLSSFMILGHPAEVLSMDGDRERDLILRSRALLMEFEAFLVSPTFPPPEQLSTNWAEFQSAFDAWKSRDSEIFISSMVAQYAELDLIWLKVKDHTKGGVANEYKDGIRDSQLMLLARIRRLAGDRTRDLIRKAVKETRRTRLPKKDERDTKPREAPVADSTNSITSDDTAPEVDSRATTQDGVSTSPPTATQPNVFSSVSQDHGIPSRRQIIHEMALDPSYRLTPPRRSRLEFMIESTAKRAFWETMKADIAMGNLTKWIPSLAETVRGKILRLLTPGSKLHRAVSDSIDVPLIQQQCQAGIYDHEKLLTYVLDLLPQICSPARDDDVAALRNSRTDDYTSRLQHLLDVLDLLHLDHANFLLMMAAPQIIADAIPHEKAMFQADLASGRTTLDRTRAWLMKSKHTLPAETPAKQTHLHAFINLFFDPTPLDDATIPETLHLDHHRIHNLRKRVYAITLGAAITVAIKTILRRDVRAPWPELQDLCFSLLFPPSSSSFSSSLSTPSPSPSTDSLSPASIAANIQTFLTSTTAVPPTTLTTLHTTTHRLLTRGHDDPVVKVMAKRVKEFLERRLEARAEGRGKEMALLAAGGLEELGRWGCGEWGAAVGEVVERMGRWWEVDWRGCGEWYEGVLV
ncbi:Tcp11-domain-containing protein [Ascodesmis nigricans]|uniref:Tcp11-domain-containing protein n=1 Tax=Ascodesmis nigricans TaxID=341454 RepID=A0A4S2MUW8_9PEZI|nr:Tcp11-domain-containing protein [Ascodesmis nigricans]